MAQNQPDITQLQAEIARLTAEVQRLNNLRFIRIYNSVPRLLLFRFASGLAMGLGTVLGGTILLSVLVLILSSIDFIPIIGDWASRIVEEVQSAR